MEMKLLEYNWGGGYGSGAYKTGDGKYSINEEYTLVSPKIGLSYELTDSTNVYFSVASANQAPPTDNELKTNRVEDKGTLEKNKEYQL